MPNQKILSVVARTKEKATLQDIIDILRGSHNKRIADKGYSSTKTFGVGREHTADEWSDYIFQMLNSGFVDIAYNDGHTFKLNTLSTKILKGELPVSLTKSVPFKEQEKSIATISTSKDKEWKSDSVLFEKLKVLRKNIADERGVPAYIIFSDKTLTEMSRLLPTSTTEMRVVTGVGEFKLDEYGRAFIRAIAEHLAETDDANSSSAGN
jgi:ATP-dependent DNA helicase RecQ